MFGQAFSFIECFLFLLTCFRRNSWLRREEKIFLPLSLPFEEQREKQAKRIRAQGAFVN